MARSVDDFIAIMLALLPRGAAWPTSADSQMADLLYAAAVEFADIDLRNEKLLKEMSPWTCSELLLEWESDYGLPEKCTTYQQTTTERRNVLIEKFSRIGSQSHQFFIDSAAALGFSITITEYDVNNPGPQTEYQGLSLNGDDWNFVYQINAPATTIVRKECGTACGEPLSTWGNELLECSIGHIAHDHRARFFAYS